MEEQYITRRIGRRTPQGGALSPILCNLVMNKLLVMLERVGRGAIAYADDAVLTILGRFPGTLRDRMQLTMK